MLDIERMIVLDSDGLEYIYVYFYPTYKEMAFMNDVHQWPCKIGRTDQDPQKRVRQQLNSCAPETPEIALVFQCENSRALENVIHNYMKIHNRFIKHTFNQEWFSTNPDEVLSIVQALYNSPEDIWSRSSD